MSKNEKNLNKKSWMGGIFPAIYDYSMKEKVIPKKLNASFGLHNKVILDELAVADGRLLELAAGSGNLADLLSSNIEYCGVDISRNLLKRAEKRFGKAGFKEFRLYQCGAESLPFENSSFDFCVCNLALNFFDDMDKAVKEASRVMKNNAVFFGSVPVPERNKKNTVIRGNLLTEEQLRELFQDNGFDFQPIDTENGAILYFRAIRV